MGSTFQTIKHITNTGTDTMRTLGLLVLSVSFTLCVTKTRQLPVRNRDPRHLSLAIRTKHNPDTDTKQQSSKAVHGKRERNPRYDNTKKHKTSAGLEHRKKPSALDHTRKHNPKSYVLKKAPENLEIPYINDIYGPETDQGTRQLPPLTPVRIPSLGHSLPFLLIKNSRRFGLGLGHGNHLDTVQFGPFGFYDNFHYS